MPKNKTIIDWKPKSEAIIDYKPKSELIVEYKPKNKMIGENLTDQLYSITLGAGMLIGLGPYITYSSAITVQSPKSP